MNHDPAGTKTLSRELHRLHGELRNIGLNPLEAISTVAAALNPSSDAGPAKLDRDSWLRVKEQVSSLPQDGNLLAVIHQVFLLSEARNGLGQYLTPLQVAEMMATVIADSEPEGLALDPFCGSGLLLDSLAFKAPSLNFLGVEINPTVANLARGLAHVSPHRIEVIEADAIALWRSGKMPKADVVVANPPFGALASSSSGADAVINMPDELRSIGKKIPAELIGLEISIQSLRDGGQLAIVLPQSVLTNERWSRYRRSAFSRARVSDVVLLPEATFGPFRGVARSCVVFATKVEHSSPYSFAYHRPNSIGYDDTGRPDGDNDLCATAQSILQGAEPWAEIDEHGHLTLRDRPDSAEERIRLGDIAEIFTGKALPRHDYIEEGAFHLKVGDLRGSFVPWTHRRRNQVPVEWIGKYPNHQLRAGDICLTCAAHKPRYIAQKVDLLDTVPESGAIPSPEVMVIRLRDDSAITPTELLYFLRGADGYDQLQSMVRGSTAHLYPRDVAELRVALPDPTNRTQLEKLHGMAADSFRSYLRFEQEAASVAPYEVLEDSD